MAASVTPPRQFEWTAARPVSDEVRAREFAVSVDGRRAPGILWQRTEASAPVALALLGHGGSGHKADRHMVELATRLVRTLGCAVAAIDGPIHGGRRRDAGDSATVKADFRALWRSDPAIDSMVSDWRAAIDALAVLPEIDPSRIGWYGISMGTAYGLPLCAAEPRIVAAVLGLWGVDYPNNERIVADAPRIECPVLFQQKWHDEVFDRASQLDLFDRLGTRNKRLHVYMGGHSHRAPEELDDVARFLSQHFSQCNAAASQEST